MSVVFLPRDSYVSHTHIDFTQDNVHDAADNDNEVKDIPGVSKVALHRQRKPEAVEQETVAMTTNSGDPTLALKAMSLRIISTVKSTVKIRFRLSDSLVTCSDWLQCCS